MTLHQLSATLKNSAREKLSGKYATAISLSLTQYATIFGATFMCILPLTYIGILFSILSGNQTGIGFLVIFYIITMLISILLGIMNTGCALFFLNLACGRTASVSDLFYGYKYLFKKSAALSTINVLVSTLPMMPYTFCSFIFEQNGKMEWAILTLLFYALGILIYIPLSLALSQCHFMLLDFPRHSIKQILSTSIQIMKGRKWKLFYIQLSFYPLLLLSTLTFGIGNLWIVPYQNLTMALFFLEIMKPTAPQNL